MERDKIEGNLKILDTLRGFASIYVLFGHARWLLWEGYTFGYKLHPNAYSILNKIGMYFFSLFQFGHQSVLFFFVLSGFVIHWSSSKRFNKTGQFDILDYLFRRLKRIYPPLLLALVLTFLLDNLGLILKLPIYFSHTLYPSINDNIHPVLNWKTLFGNLGFLQTVYTGVWGTDGPLWSLMYEWWFYVLYIPFIWLFRKNRILASLLVLALWVISLEFQFGPLLLKMILNYFVTWYLGMLLADVLLNEKISVKLAGLYLLVILLFSVLRYYRGIGGDVILAIGIVCLLFVLLTTNIGRYLKSLHKLGEFSYTLYIIHVPILCLMSGFIMYYNKMLPMHFYYLICGIVISLVSAYILHFIVEKPFMGKQKTKVSEKTT
jgi:peptidoglycan/LPS O-acetylase OafA/YrhL